METIIGVIRKICLGFVFFYFFVLLLTKMGNSQDSTCIKYYKPIISKNSSLGRIGLHVKKRGAIIDTFVDLNDVIMIQINQGELDGCAAYVRNGEVHVEERLVDIKRKIEAMAYPNMYQTNRRELVNLLFVEKYDWCQRLVILDDELESQVGENFRACIEQNLEH